MWLLLLFLLVPAIFLGVMLSVWAWQLVTGRAISGWWKTLFRRHDQPLWYWLWMAWQSVIIAFAVVMFSRWAVYVWRVMDRVQHRM